MTRSFISLDEGLTALESSLPELISALRQVKDPDANAIGTWSVRDVAVHLVHVFEEDLRIANGQGSAAPSIAELTSYNQAQVDSSKERDVNVLADQIESAAGKYIALLGGLETDHLVRWAGIEIPISTSIAADIGECLLHGYDITRAEGKPWHIDPYRAALVGRGISPMTMSSVDKEAAAGLSACFDLRLRGHWQLHFVFTNGNLSIEEPSDRRVDVHISAEAVAFMLVGYGRVSQWGPLAKGKIVAWGLKPWLALRFGSLFRNP